jgi:hypothetical protein
VFKYYHKGHKDITKSAEVADWIKRVDEDVETSAVPTK